MVRRRVSLFALILVIAANAFAAQKRRAVVAPDAPHFCDFGSDIAGMNVPPDLCLRKFADVPTARVLLFAPNGDLFVASPRRQPSGGAPPGAAAIFLLRQTDTTKPPERFLFADGDAFESVHALLIANNTFYYSTADAVYAVPYTSGSTRISNATPVKIATLPVANYTRWTHSLAASTDGSIYVATGQFDDGKCAMLDATLDTHIGAILRIGPGHAERGDIVVQGLRDPLYIRCMPWGTCYLAELSGDVWDAVGGSEKLMEIHDGDSLGYPCCVSRDNPNLDINGDGIPDTGPRPDCSQIAIPKMTFTLHDTPFGFDWERGFGWPEPYRGAFFVGLHGSFGLWRNTGLQWAPSDPVTHLPTQALQNLLTGFGRTGPISRVADVMFGPDGRLYFTDDHGGGVYWIAPRSLRRPGH